MEKAGPYIRTVVEQLRYEFCRTYVLWVETRDSNLYRNYEKEQIWDEYCEARDAWMLAPRDQSFNR